jgi:hypothetical protein
LSLSGDAVKADADAGQQAEREHTGIASCERRARLRSEVQQLEVASVSRPWDDDLNHQYCRVSVLAGQLRSTNPNAAARLKERIAKIGSLKACANGSSTAS